MTVFVQPFMSAHQNELDTVHKWLGEMPKTAVYTKITSKKQIKKKCKKLNVLVNPIGQI